MSQHLISMAIGPVQDFIAQARRSRDLWFGSHLLSEISRAAAKGIATAGGQLVFPALDRNDPELEPCDGMTRNGSADTPPLAIANKILATADSADLADQCVRAARQAALDRWKELAETVRKYVQPLLAWPEVESIWSEQVESVIEFYAAAAQVAPESFGEVRDVLERQLAARKNIRPFRQFQYHRDGAPKSSFDGSRVSVLKSSRKGESVRNRYRIPQTENLDAIGVIKRAGGQPEQFVPIANVALSHWLSQARQDKSLSDRIDNLERSMLGGPFQDLFGRVDRTGTPAGSVFRTDAQVFLSDRLEAMLIENEVVNSRTELNSHPAYKELSDEIKKRILERCSWEPYPYVATLIADGDRMGACLRHLNNTNDLRQFSILLGQFANAARQIVEQECSGSLLYAGGDDVVAFVPLATVVDCAVKLRHAFTEVMQPGKALPSKWPSSTGEYALPTLSVGISIGHILSGMGNLLEGGRIAEKFAKGSDLPTSKQRNALAVRVDKRSGGTLVWRCRWDHDESPSDQLSQAISRLSRHEQAAILPSTKIAEVRRDLTRFPKPGTSETASGQWGQFLSHDILRTLGRAALGVNESSSTGSDDGGRLCRIAENFGLPWPMPTDYATCHQTINDWTTLHLIARELVRGTCNSNAPAKEVA